MADLVSFSTSSLLPSFTNRKLIYLRFSCRNLLPLGFSQASRNDQHIERHHRDYAECDYVFHFFTSFVLQNKLVGRCAELPLFKAVLNAIWARMAPAVAPATVCLLTIKIIFGRYRNVTRIVGWRLHADRANVPVGQAFTHR